MSGNFRNESFPKTFVKIIRCNFRGGKRLEGARNDLPTVTPWTLEIHSCFLSHWTVLSTLKERWWTGAHAWINHQSNCHRLASRAIHVINGNLPDTVTFSFCPLHTTVGYSQMLNNQEKWRFLTFWNKRLNQSRSTQKAIPWICKFQRNIRKASFSLSLVFF